MSAGSALAKVHINNPQEARTEISFSSSGPRIQEIQRPERCESTAATVGSVHVGGLPLRDEASMHSKPRTIELCAGSGGFSAALFRRGFDCLAIDCARNRFRVKHAITTIDLSTDAGTEIVLASLDPAVTMFVFAGIPCGTASKAREIPIRGKQALLLNGPAPKPLRSVDEPWGLATLTGLDLAKVQLANAVYRNVGRILQRCFELGIKRGAENPRGSYTWQLPPYAILLDQGCEDFDYQNCAHEGTRPKWSRIRSDLYKLKRIEKVCPGISAAHQHEPWGVLVVNEKTAFATAGEAEYTSALCNLMADAVVDYVNEQGVFEVGIRFNDDYNSASTNQRSRAAGSAARSTTGKRPLQIISEFKEVIAMKLVDMEPKRHKLLRTIYKGDSGFAAEEVVVGVFREPEDFLIAALAAKHPVDDLKAVDERLVQNIKWIFSSGPAVVGKFRLDAIKALVKLIADNRDEDNRIVADLPPSMRSVLSGKKLHTLRCLSKQVGFKDFSIVDDACEGFHLTGLAPYTRYFEERLKIPVSTVDQIRSAATINNSQIFAKVHSSGSLETDSELWAKTLKERDKGWLSGPSYTISEVEMQVGKCVISRRFPLMQAKMRAIDDFNESNVNLAFGTSDKLSFHDVDYISSIVNAIIMVRKQTNLPLSWNGRSRIQGRCLDLASAYKQWAVAVSALWSSVVAVWDPDKKAPALFVQHTLPFGASAAVLHFNRLSRLMWEIFVVVLRLIAANFYDDFPMFEPLATATLARTASELFLKLLGWEFSVDPSKSLPFAEIFTSLGVVFDLSRFDEGLAYVSNKLSRVELAKDTIKHFISKGFVTAVERDSLRGKLQYMERYVFGRVGKFIIRSLDGGRPDFKGTFNLSAGDKLLLNAAIVWLDDCAPRDIRPVDDSPPILIFTDGAEGDVAGCDAACGALLVDPKTGLREYFGEAIPGELVTEWKDAGAKKIIAQAELLPIALAKEFWARIIAGRKVLLFVDNEGAKFSCVKMYSDNLHSRRILACMAKAELKTQSWTWFTRVASHSNPADPASRLEHSVMSNLYKAKRICVTMPLSLAK